MLLSMQNVSFSFGARTMFENINWQIGTNERIGLIGSNGTGKSTLLRLITGSYSIDSGTISKPKDVTIGFFNQDLLSFSTTESILTVGMQAFEKATAVEKEMNRILSDLESKPDDEKLLDEYSHALHDFEVAGGYEMEHKTAEVLEGLGFTTEQLQKPYDQFSGGWRMRVLLAKLMLQAPDILMLDEPTNHLDLPSIEWLERYLSNYPGSVVIVSHDRYFLDRMVTKIVEVWQRDLVQYTGNYSFYQKEKAERIALQQRAYENQQDYIRQQERFIERFRAQATKAAQAQSAIKRLDKLDMIEAPSTAIPTLNINFEVGIQPGKIICELNNVSKAYGNNIILDNTSATINRGDKIALIGANGKGKSTLLRIISGKEQIEGERKEGHNVQESFYAQHQLEALNIENEILDELKDHSFGKTEMELRQLLGCFLFSGDDVFKKIKVLSGGEKARVALAKVINAKANFLMLDEPTNHLDLQSIEMLIEALNKYEGTFVLVSHDRYFVSKTANKIWEIEDNKIIEFKGSLDEWQIWKQEKEAKKQAELSNKNVPVQKKEVVKEPIVKPVDQSKLKVLQAKKRSLEKIEPQLSKLLLEKENLEQQLAMESNYSDAQKFKQIELKYKEATSNWTLKNQEYEQLLEEIMILEDEM